jgi:hypothetical protein
MPLGPWQNPKILSTSKTLQPSIQIDSLLLEDVKFDVLFELMYEAVNFPSP